MAKKKSTKKALLASVLALTLSSSMLVGTTFAWFTDSVTSSNNIIQTGTLDVSLEYSDEVLTDVNDARWVDASQGTIFNYSNWEPGYTAVKYVKIENEGSLDLKFTLSIIPNGEAGEVNLADVIEVYMVSGATAVERSALTPDSAYYVGNLTSLMNDKDGAAYGVLYADDADKAGNVYEVYTIALKMSTSAGNEYQGKSVGGGFAVQLLATQLASEKDSFDNTYDENADYAVVVKNATELNNAIKTVADGGIIALSEDVTFDATSATNSGGTWYEGIYYVGDKSFTIDLGGNTITNDSAVNDYLMLFKNDGSKANTITLKNGTIEASSSAYCAICTSSTSTQQITINLENVNVIGANANGSVAKIRGGAVLNVKDGTVITGKDSYLGIENANSTVNIYDGAEIYQNGSTSYNGCLVGVGSDGTVNVYGGYGKGVAGGFIAMTSGGTINVHGGEWIADTDGTFSGNDHVLIAQSDKATYGGGNSVVNVYGGTFSGGYNCYGNAVGDAQINISVGTFDEDPTDYVANSYQAVENADGTYTVLPKVGGAELTYYADGLSDANSSKNYYVASGAGMDTVAEKINDGTLAKNTNITLLTDIDLTDVDYAPISGNKGDSWYTGTFDGQNHTITGMTVNAYEGGLIGSSNGTVKNVIIDGATVTGSYHAAGIVGTGYGSIQNCTVKNSAIIGNYAGALRGYSASGTNTGNTVENCTINGKYAAGGLFGLVTADGKNTISDNTVKNCDIYCEVPSGNSYNGIGEVVGRSASDKVVIENNMTENVTLH